MADVGHAEERALAWVLGELKKKNGPPQATGQWCDEHRRKEDGDEGPPVASVTQ